MLEREPAPVGLFLFVDQRFDGEQLLFDEVVEPELETTRFEPVSNGQHARLQLAEALAGGRDDRYHRAAEFLRQFFVIDLHAALARHVHHVECEHQRHTHFEQLHGEIEIALQVAGIDHIHDQVGLPRQQVIPGHLFVERGGVE